MNDLTAPAAMSTRDLLGEATAGLLARPGRTVLTILGTMIGLGALVATLGLSRTASNRIIGRFDALAATEVVVSARAGGTGPVADAIPWDAPARVARLDGVVAVGNVSTVDVGGALVSTSPVSDPQAQTDFDLSVQAASPGLWRSVRATLRSGRTPDQGHSDRSERVAVLGAGAALRLGIVGVEQQPAIAIGDEIFVVIGILDSIERQAKLSGAVVIPEGTARTRYRLRSPEHVVIETNIGAAALITKQVAHALRPDDLAALKIVSPNEPRRVKDNVESDLNVLFLILGAVSLLVGAIGIANVTLVSVMERTGEIGLRRALGASRRHIAQQFLIESSVIGLVGGILGASVGTLVVVGVAAYQGWTPVIDPYVPIVAPLLGAVIGLVSGAYPASRAAFLEPVDALRSGI